MTDTHRDPAPTGNPDQDHRRRRFRSCQHGKPTTARPVVVVVGAWLSASVTAVAAPAMREAEPIDSTGVVEGQHIPVPTHGTVVAGVLDDAGTTTLPMPTTTTEAIDTSDVAAEGGVVTAADEGTHPPDTTTTITVHDPVPITIVADEASRIVETPSAPADVILERATSPVGPDDINQVTDAGAPGGLTSINGAATVEHGDGALVIRITTKTEQRDIPIPAGREEWPDATLLSGVIELGRAGVPGVRSETLEVVYHNGVKVSEAVTAVTETAPLNEIVRVGTAVSEAATKNWEALAFCESGGDPTIVSASGTYHGLYQFDLSTWRSVGGSGLPSQAPAEEQTLRAMALYEMYGRQPWPVCGKYL